MKLSIILISLIFFCLEIYSQEISQPIKIMQTDSADAVPFATIKLKNKPQVYVADEKGFALIKASKNDTLQVSAIGYFPIELPFILTQNTSVFRIYLLSRNINLKEVTIKGIGTKEELKLAILRMRIEEKQKDIPGLKTYHGPFRKPPPTILNPISLIYETDWAKQRRSKKWSKSIIIPEIK